MAGYAFHDKKMGFGYDTSGMHLESFLRTLPKDDPIFTCLVSPEKITEETEREVYNENYRY